MNVAFLMLAASQVDGGNAGIRESVENR